MIDKSKGTTTIGNITMPTTIYEALKKVKALGESGHGGFTGSVAANYADSALYYCQNQYDFPELCARTLSNMNTMRGDEVKEIRKLLRAYLKEVGF